MSTINRIAIRHVDVERGVALRKRCTRPEVLFDPQPDDLCETIFFKPEDPGPNPEEAYDCANVK